MPLFRKREKCPHCEGRSVEIEPGILWFCANCAANGPLVDGSPIDLGLRGEPRQGEWERYEPAIPLAAQLGGASPESALIIASPELSARLDDAVFRWFFALSATPFDIDDPDLEAAEATYIRNLLADPTVRADEARFYVLTAVSGSGWFWRVAEEGDEECPPSEAALGWLARYRESGHVGSRSEIVGLTAGAIAEEAALEEHSPGGPELGPFFFAVGWTMTSAVLLDPQPQLAGIHPSEFLQRSFRFGVALRDAEVAFDSSS